MTYYHVERDPFDVIEAHGVYSESGADGGDRDFFQNVDVTTLRPEDKQRRRASRSGFDNLVLRKGEALYTVKGRILARAKKLQQAKGLRTAA